MGNIFSRLTASNVNNANNRNNRTDETAANARYSGLKAENEVSPETRAPEPHHSTPFREVADTPPPQKSQPSQPKPAEVTAPPKEPIVYTTTFETQVDAAPPHPLEEKLGQEIQFDQIEIETNLFTPEVEDAVIKIQAGIRGYLARKQVKELKKDNQEVGDNNRFTSNQEETSVVPPPPNFDDLQSKANEEFCHLPQNLIETPNKSDQVELIDNKYLLSNSDEKITNESVDKTPVVQCGPDVDDKCPAVEAKQNELLEDLTAMKDKNSFQNEGVDDSKIQSNENEFTDLQTQPKDYIDVEHKVSTSEVPLLKTCSEKAIEKLSKSAENISLIKESAVSTKDNASVNQAVDSAENKDPESVIKDIIQLSESKPHEQNKIEEKSIEQQMVEMLFDEQTNINNNKVVAIELFKHDVSEQELAKVEVINEPETKKNIEDRVYKTSLDQFVVKPVQQKPEAIPTSEPQVKEQVIESTPVTEQKIEIISSNSRKNSSANQEEESRPVAQVLEVVPNAQPLIQVEEQNGTVLDEEEAAIRIQAAFRGYQIRRSLSREASPNRATNNSNPGDQQQTQNQISHELFLSSNQSESQAVITNEKNDSYGVDPMAPQQLNTSLERLEDELLQQLISADDDDQVFIDDNSGVNQQQFIEQNDQITNLALLSQTNQPQQEIRVDEQTFPVVVPEEAQVLIDEQISQNVSEQNEKIEINMKEKPNSLDSDALIVDFSQLNPNDNSNGETNSNEVAAQDNNGNTFIQTNTDNQSSHVENNDFLNNIKQCSADNKITTETENDKLFDMESDSLDYELKQSDHSKESFETNLMLNQDITERPEPEPQIQTQVEPPTPADLTEIMPQTMFISAEKPVLTDISSPESESESVNKLERGSQIPVLESKKKIGLDIPNKQLHGILKETDSQIHSNLFPEEQTQSTSEEISSPDDDPEFIGLGPNTPIPVRASSPNPFGKKRRKGRKSGSRKN